jgi:hypothetical protein
MIIFKNNCIKCVEYEQKMYICITKQKNTL